MDENSYREIDDVFTHAAISPRYSNCGDIASGTRHALTNRRRNWARLMVSALGEDIQEVAYLSRYKDKDESEALYKVRLDMLEGLIDEKLALVDPDSDLF